MNDVQSRSVIHVIEPQHLFVPALIDVFTEAGLFVDYVGARIEPRRLLDDQPDMIFIDTDFLENALEGVRIAHVLVPKAEICAYTTARGDAETRALRTAGADTLLEKSADRRAIVQGLREIDRRRRSRRDRE